MRVVISVAWLALAAFFAYVGVALQADAGRDLPPYDIADSRMEFRAGGVRVEFDVAGTLAEGPIQDLADDFNAYLAEQGAAAREHRARAAAACYGAAAAALIGALLSSRRPSSQLATSAASRSSPSRVASSSALASQAGKGRS